MSDPQTTSNASASSERFDHIVRVRTLVWSLKESLSNLIKIAAKNIEKNSQLDNGQKANDTKTPRIDKALEDIFSIFNQIELHLKTIQECAVQQKQSQKYLPFTVSASKTETGLIDSTISENAISYSQYLNIVKNQINFTESLEKMLIEGAKRIGNE